MQAYQPDIGPPICGICSKPAESAIPMVHNASENQDASGWIGQHLELIPQNARVLDLACGSGRHTRLLAARGFSVIAVDQDLSRIRDLEDRDNIELREADLEARDWPLAGERFAAIVVSNYLYRPHLRTLINNLANDGVLIYTTFARGNEKLGRPRNPDFLLRPDELLDTFGAELHVIAFEQVTVDTPSPAVRQRICAVGKTHPLARN
jgi:SAM-dependent methyltransferase